MKLSSIIILVSIIISFFSTTHAEQISAGKFVFIRGDVTINRVINNKPTQMKAQMNDPVFKSDVVETTSNAAARIRLIDSNQIDIYPKTKLSISEYIYKPAENKKNVELSIDFGKVQSTVRQKYDGTKNTYRVKTPGIVAGVRGTIFTVGFESGRSSTSVTEGIVDVRVNIPVQAVGSAESAGALVKAQQKIEFSPSQKRIDVINFSQVDQEKIKAEREIFKEADIKIEEKIEEKNDQSEKSSNDLNSSASEISNQKKEKSSSDKKPKKDQSSVDAVGSSIEQSDEVSSDDKDKDNVKGRGRDKIKDKADQTKGSGRSDRAEDALENARGQQIKEAVSKGLKGQEKSSSESGAARRNEALQRKLKELNKISETTNEQSKERLKQQAEEEAARKKAEELAEEAKRLAEEARKKAEEAAAKEKAESGN